MPNFVVETADMYKNCLNKYCFNQDTVYNYKSELTGTRGLPVCT